MGWTETEQLLCVLEDGIVRMYNILGEYTQFSLGKVNLENLNEDVFTKIVLAINEKLNGKTCHLLFP